jgi:hypothetical protein
MLSSEKMATSLNRFAYEKRTKRNGEIGLAALRVRLPDNNDKLISIPQRSRRSSRLEGIAFASRDFEDRDSAIAKVAILPAATKNGPLRPF